MFVFSFCYSYYKTNVANLSFAIQHRQIADFSVIIVDGPPFRVEVYRNGNLQITLRSERFVMENVGIFCRVLCFIISLYIKTLYCFCFSDKRQ